MRMLARNVTQLVQMDEALPCLIVAHASEEVDTVDVSGRCRFAGCSGTPAFAFIAPDIFF